MRFLLFLCRPHNSRILQHKENNYSDNHTVGKYNLCDYLQLGLCVALGNSIHSDLNLYAVLTVFMQTSQFTNFAAQRGCLQRQPYCDFNKFELSGVTSFAVIYG